MNLYLTCERDYLNGIKIYKQLVNQIEYENTERQIKNLENKQKKMVCEYVPIEDKNKDEEGETDESDYDKDEYEDEDEYEEQMLIQIDNKKDGIYKQ